jgi:ABC-2 type transport system ATP-binding protein
MTPEVSAPADVPQRPVASKATARQVPVNSVADAVWSLVSSLVGRFAGNSPTAPVESPAMWTLLAAARRETFGSSPTLQTVANPVTSGLTAGTGDVPPLAASVAATQPTVVAIAQTPLLAWLQQLPIIGPVFVTPVVAAIDQIPIVSDILHPLIGYPLQMGLPAGTPLPRDVKVISFDGTQIYTHFMPAAGLQAGQRAPTILDGPGLGMPGATNVDGTVLDGILTDNLGAVGIATLRQAGYNVVTWDPRGEYFSGGVSQIDSPDFEARDVSAIISWVAQQPEVQLDGPGDPRIGMVGASYGGGIQLVTAATDHRVDAIVPTIAWNTLNTSLYKNESFKSGWGTLLEGVLQLTLARTIPELLPATIYGDLTGLVTQSDQDLLAARGPGGIRGFPDLVSKITAPTLLIQGTVDTLFSLQEADNNAKTLIADGVPTKVLWFCGGHGLCVNDLLDTRDGALIDLRTLEWLDRYVKGEAVPTGPQFEWVDQSGQYFSSNVYPVAPGNSIVASSSAPGVLPLLPFLGGSALLGVLPIGGGWAPNALNLTTAAATATTYIVGAPKLTLTYSGLGVSSHVYAQLVDNTTGLVLGNQVTPIPVTLDGQTHTISVPLEPIAHTLRPGESVTLQLVASAADYETIWSLGALNVSNMQISLPTANAAAVSPESGIVLTNAA